MQTHWKLNDKSKLILFFSGWAMDENPSSLLECNDADICTCFDYRNFETDDLERWKSYKEIVLVSWSTGVWAAEQVLSNANLPISKAIAINGTPTTVDDKTGISRAIFEGTYTNLSLPTMQKFQRRMVGSASAFTTFAEIKPQRELEDQKEELAKILDFDFTKYNSAYLKWDKAFVGIKDAIFPPQNQLNYWTSRCEIVETEMPHYPFDGISDWDSFIR